MLIPKDLKAIYEEAVKLVDEENLATLKKFEEAEKLYESWELKTLCYNTNFLVSVNYWSARNNNVWDYELGSLTEILQELKDWKKLNSNKLWIKTDIEWYHDEDNKDEEPTVELIWKYYELKKPYFLTIEWEDLKRLYYKPKFKELLSKKLFEDVQKVDDSIEYKKDIECKILTLFETGAIDWEMVATLTYSDCNL